VGGTLADGGAPPAAVAPAGARALRLEIGLPPAAVLEAPVAAPNAADAAAGAMAERPRLAVDAEAMFRDAIRSSSARPANVWVAHFFLCLDDEEAVD
jgi:hypothetical protein